MELAGKRVAVLAEDMYQELELWYPLLRLREAGATVIVVGMPGVKEYQSKHGYPVPVDAAADAVSAHDFDAVIIPGGYAPDRMRRHKPMLDLVRRVFEHGGVVAAICHAAWVPISPASCGAGVPPVCRPSRTTWSTPGLPTWTKRSCRTAT